MSRPWTDEDNAILADAWEAGTRVRDIARRLKRDDGEVRQQRRALELPERTRSTYDKDTWGGQIKAWPRLPRDAFA